MGIRTPTHAPPRPRLLSNLYPTASVSVNPRLIGVVCLSLIDGHLFFYSRQQLLSSHFFRGMLCFAVGHMQNSRPSKLLRRGLSYFPFVTLCPKKSLREPVALVLWFNHNHDSAMETKMGSSKSVNHKHKLRMGLLQSPVMLVGHDVVFPYDTNSLGTPHWW